MLMAWLLKPTPKFSITIINVYKIKIAVAKIVYSILLPITTDNTLVLTHLNLVHSPLVHYPVECICLPYVYW